MENRKSLADFSFGNLIRVKCPWPERFNGNHREVEAVLDGTHPLIGKRGIVDFIDEQTGVIWVLLEDGSRNWFILSEIEKVEADEVKK